MPISNLEGLFPQISALELYPLFQNAPVGICLFQGKTHVYAVANPAYQRIVFGELKDVHGLSIEDTLNTNSNRAYIGLLDQVFSTGKSFSATESKLFVPTGAGEFKEIYINFTVQARHDKEGAVSGIMVMVHEVTEQVLARLRAEQAVQSRDEFLSIASHELKTPLTSLQLQCQMAKRNLEKETGTQLSFEKVKKLIDQTDKSVQRLTRLVEDMFDISRISTGKLILNREEFDLHELAREVIGRLEPQIIAAQVEVKLSGESVKGYWDRFRLDQVITNLLTNALRYGEGSPVEISVQRERKTVLLKVRDHGPGIYPGNQQRIFERFERAHSSNSITGLGLGLYITQEIVNRHGGSVSVESVVGQGALFTVELPVLRS